MTDITFKIDIFFKNKKNFNFYKYNISAVLYYKKKSISIYFNRIFEIKLINQLNNNINIFILRLENKKIIAIVKYVYKNPVKCHITHIDFMKINLNDFFLISIPIFYIGINKSDYIRNGGVLLKYFNCLLFKSNAISLCKNVIIDISHKKTKIYLNEIKIPYGLSIVGSNNYLISNILLFKSTVQK